VAGVQDYEAFAVRPRERKAFKSAARHCRDLPITLVGRLTGEPGAWLERAGLLEALPASFSHF
jgi:hypothetical protein